MRWSSLNSCHSSTHVPAPWICLLKCHYFVRLAALVSVPQSSLYILMIFILRAISTKQYFTNFIFKNIYLAQPGLSCSMQDLQLAAFKLLTGACRIQFLDQGLNLGLLLGELQVLDTGPSGKSLTDLKMYIAFSCNILKAGIQLSIIASQSAVTRRQL